MKYAFSIIKYLKNRCTAESSATAILNGSANVTTALKKAFMDRWCDFWMLENTIFILLFKVCKALEIFSTCLAEPFYISLWKLFYITTSFKIYQTIYF